ncbi:Uma2 family endonuclease [Gemmata sp. JC673]|uniref:Uma2 family endonuclease n=1 Tax=Gemmata algarum TaxID=2975278 RepID=A0ABU5F9C7_9BACT|nr:Uma2 family endonuclease [Gemmata algarum]MDY3562451.1 Uma2 family endonuclease [Gemmata algarum]
MSAISTPMPSAPADTTTPPPTGPKPWRWTVEQYYELGAKGFFAGKRVELVRGEIVEMSPISVAHANAVGLVTDALTVIFAIGYHLNVQQPFSVPGSAPGSEPQPDVTVVAGPRRSATAHPIQAALLVEVADSTLFFDTTTKAELYATAAVPEYWVLDLSNRRLLVFRDPQPLPAGLSATAYQTHLALGPSDTVSPLAAPSASVAVADLLP